jgi:sulfur-oxidizing protein SoxB
MTALIQRQRMPFAARLAEPLATTDGLLYRRGNFNGTFDQVIVEGLMRVLDAQVALSPGFRWGTTLLPGDTITREHLLEQTAITYPATTVTAMTGATLKALLEDVADNLFNPDPYYQQGGDMVRVGGMRYACAPDAPMGARISDMRIAGTPLEADKTYKVAGWAPVAEGVSGTPVWDVLEQYLRAEKVLAPRSPDTPRLVGVAGNPGIEA